jgi:hypothetical protein
MLVKNSIGWEVQFLTKKGWKNCLDDGSKPQVYKTREAAELSMQSCKKMCDKVGMEIRVYESLH